MNRPTDRSASPASSDGTLSPVNPASAAVEERDVSPAEPQVDPSLEKYMAIVKQQREREQKVCVCVCYARKFELCRVLILVTVRRSSV